MALGSAKTMSAIVEMANAAAMANAPMGHVFAAIRQPLSIPKTISVTFSMIFGFVITQALAKSETNAAKLAKA